MTARIGPGTGFVSAQRFGPAPVSGALKFIGFRGELFGKFAKLFLRAKLKGSSAMPLDSEPPNAGSKSFAAGVFRPNRA